MKPSVQRKAETGVPAEERGARTVTALRLVLIQPAQERVGAPDVVLGISGLRNGISLITLV